MSYIDGSIYECVDKKNLEESKNADSKRTWFPTIASQVPHRILSYHLEPLLANFRTMFPRGAAMWPDKQVPGESWYNVNPFLHHWKAFRTVRYLRRLFSRMLEERDQSWLEFEDDLIGSPYRVRNYFLLGRNLTENAMRVSLYYGLLERYCPLDGVSGVLEIGAGFGSFTGVLATMHPEKSFFLVELPVPALLSYYYLSEKLGADLLYKNGDNSTGKGISVLMPWVFDTLDIKAELAINTMSFQHMTEANLRFYFSRLRNLEIKTIFSINRERGQQPGEVCFLDIASDCGFKLIEKYDLKPWTHKHFVHILVPS